MLTTLQPVGVDSRHLHYMKKKIAKIKVRQCKK